MTKNQCKNKITRLEDKIGEMQEQVIHYKRQVKVLDAEDSRKLLDKYHIESEELAELIYRQKHQAKADEKKEDTETEIKSLPKPKPQKEVKVPEPEQDQTPATASASASATHVNPLDMFKRQEA